jgi:hypothetical protein
MRRHNPHGSGSTPSTFSKPHFFWTAWFPRSDDRYFGETTAFHKSDVSIAMRDGLAMKHAGSDMKPGGSVTKRREFENKTPGDETQPSGVKKKRRVGAIEPA